MISSRTEKVLLAHPAFKLSALFGLALTIAGIEIVNYAAHYSSTTTWDCGGGRCATNDFAGGAPVLGILALAIGAVFLSGTIRTASAPLALLAGSAAAFAGWRGAVNDQLVTAGSVRVGTTIAFVTGTVGLVLVVVTGVREVRRSGFLWALSGRSATWGRVTNFESIGGDRKYCHGTVCFNDANGCRHSVRTRVPRESFTRPPRVYYKPKNPTDPDTLRVGKPSKPLTATTAEAQLPAAIALIPLPSDVQCPAPARPAAV